MKTIQTNQSLISHLKGLASDKRALCVELGLMTKAELRNIARLMGMPFRSCATAELKAGIIETIRHHWYGHR